MIEGPLLPSEVRDLLARLPLFDLLDLFTTALEDHGSRLDSVFYDVLVEMGARLLAARKVLDARPIHHPEMPSAGLNLER